MRAVTCGLLVLWVACASGGQTFPASAPGLTETDRLGAESLRHSATSLVHDRQGTPHWRDRLIALSFLADALVPKDPDTHLLLRSIYESEEQLALAAASARVQFDADPRDHMLGQLWLRLEHDAKNVTEDRITFLKGVLARQELPNALRAQAAVMLGDNFLRRDDKDEARTAYEQARSLDRYHALALARLQSLGKGRALPDSAAALLAYLRSSPRSSQAAANLGLLLANVGSHDAALKFFEHAERVLKDQLGVQTAPHDLMVPFLNVALDAGGAAQALEKFAPLREQFAESVDFQTLLIEAYRAAGKDAEADELVKVLATQLEKKRPATATSAAPAQELAMFYLVTLPHPEASLAYAKTAEQRAPLHPVTLRLLGAAKLVSDQEHLVAAGESKLKGLIDTDIYAAAFLAEHYFAKGDADAGSKAILTGAAVGRSGPAFRRLRTLAATHKDKVSIPPHDAKNDVEATLTVFGKPYFEMGQTPEKFLSVTIQPAREKFAPGEPIEIEVVLTNVGAVDVPMGREGLCNPVFSLTVTVEGQAKASFTDLPLVSLPAPRYLAPGKSVRRRKRIDVGRLGKYLLGRPLDGVSLRIIGMLDPMQAGEAFRSSVPTVQAKPATLRRVDLMECFNLPAQGDWAQRYKSMLPYIVEDFQKGPLARRCRAARQVGALLAVARGMETGILRLPEPRRQAVTKPVLLSMMHAVMKDRDSAVRAEMLAALQHVRLDESILSLLAPHIEDRSALVRFRMVELIGASGTSGRKTIVDYLAQDPDKWVRMMASVFTRSTRPSLK